MQNSVENIIKDGIRISLKDHFKERRGKLEIMADILLVTRDGARKTEIVYKANLNFTRIERYIPFLEERGMIKNSDQVYKTTEKGEEFLREYAKMRGLIIT